jgi:hypothetical protein
MDRLVKEAIEIRLHPDNCNRADGLNLSHTWRPVIKMFQRPRDAPLAKHGQDAGRKPTPPTGPQTRYIYVTLETPLTQQTMMMMMIEMVFETAHDAAVSPR